MTILESVKVEHMLEYYNIPLIVKRARWIEETCNDNRKNNPGKTYFGENKISREMALIISIFCYGIKEDGEWNFSSDSDNFERIEWENENEKIEIENEKSEIKK